ncbi:MAG TPA: ATP synthase subunit I [Xanthobacteraceae bacterium]|nr:ATP synthase subunit I [Xanthobacteraceae bacterium]
MTHTHLIAHPELAALMALAGLVFGLIYFAALKRSVSLLVGGSGFLGPLALTLGRIGAAAALLVVAAKLGAAPLLAAFAGYLMARGVALRAERRAG